MWRARRGLRRFGRGPRRGRLREGEWNYRQRDRQGGERFYNLDHHGSLPPLSILFMPEHSYGIPLSKGSPMGAPTANAPPQSRKLLELRSEPLRAPSAARRLFLWGPEPG